MIAHRIYAGPVLSKGRAYTRDLLFLTGPAQDVVIKVHIHVDRHPDLSDVVAHVWHDRWVHVRSLKDDEWWSWVPGYDRGHQPRADDRTKHVADVLLGQIDSDYVNRLIA